MQISLSPAEMKVALLDLSLDAVRPYLAILGLGRPTDVRFAACLPSVYRASLSGEEHGDPQAFVTAALSAAAALGPSYAERIRDWTCYIYPCPSEFQTSLQRWQRVILRGTRPDSGSAPEFVRRLSHLLSTVPKAPSNLRPVSDWDRAHTPPPESLGLDAFEWLQTAVDNYAFLASTTRLLRDPRLVEELPIFTSWAATIAATLRLPVGSLDAPERTLRLPPSLDAVGEPDARSGS